MEIKNNGEMFYIGDEINPDAKLIYSVVDNIMKINGTVVKTKLQGQGIAGKITKYALDYAREKNYKVQPICFYTVKYMEKHKEYNDLQI